MKLRNCRTNDGPAGAVWDARNRMRAYYQGDPWEGGRPVERYLYDASG